MEGYFGENISGFSFKLNILLKDSPRLLIRRQSKCIEKARQAYLHLSLPLSASLFPSPFFSLFFLGPSLLKHGEFIQCFQSLWDKEISYSGSPQLFCSLFFNLSIYIDKSCLLFSGDNYLKTGSIDCVGSPILALEPNPVFKSRLTTDKADYLNAIWLLVHSFTSEEW